MTDIVVSKCETALAAGTVSVPEYPPPKGPRVSDADAVVLVVSVPVALAVPAGAGVGRTGGFTVPLVHDESTNASPPTIKRLGRRMDRMTNERCNIKAGLGGEYTPASAPTSSGCEEYELPQSVPAYDRKRSARGEAYCVSGAMPRGPITVTATS